MQNYLKKIAFIFMLSIPVWAQSPFSLYIFATGMAMDYQEYDTKDTLIDSEDADFGDIGGVDVGLDYTFWDKQNFYTLIELDYQNVSGSSIYRGSELDSNNSYGSLVSATQNRLKDLHFMLKGVYKLSPLFGVKIGAGYGQHTWERDLSAIQSETYKWDYLRLIAGTLFKINAISKLSFDLFGAYEHAFSPKMNTNIKGQDLDFDLGSVECYEADIYVIYELSHRFDLVGGYIFKRQTIDKSNIIQVDSLKYYEPRSRDNQQFYKLGLQYSF